MQFDNLFGYEEQQQQQLIQPFYVENVKEQLKQLHPSFLLNNNLKRGKKQSKRLYRLNQQNSLSFKSKAKIQKKMYKEQNTVKMSRNKFTNNFTQNLRTKVSLPQIKFSETQRNEFIKLDKLRNLPHQSTLDVLFVSIGYAKQLDLKFAFKINKIDGNIAIGVCNKDILAQQNDQHNNLNGTQGLFLLQNDGQVYPSQEIQVLQGQPFEFQQSNIIIVIVNFSKQYIKQNKYNHQTEFSINFDTTNELYPCVVFQKLSQFKKISQVTIINPKTLKIIDGSSCFGDL